MRLTAFIRLDHDTKCVVTGYIQSLCNTAGQEENEERRRRRGGGGEEVSISLHNSHIR